MSNQERTILTVLPKKKDLSKEARSGVSLHCHTLFSKEMLDFLPHYAERIPVISHFWKKEQRDYLAREGRTIDFSTAYWSPPLPESEVYRMEKEQLNRLGLSEIVSITDHDSIDANLRLNESVDNDRAPVSLEWTVPFEVGFFHLGIHNLPLGRAVEITDELLRFTLSDPEAPAAERPTLPELFALLDEIPGVLIVFNHPFWDIEMIGQDNHERLLRTFLSEYAQWIHALEINGFRAWSENRKVVDLARTLGIPLVAGGDRHGCQANTVVNLTDSSSFDDFVREVRVDKFSRVAVLPEYGQPLVSRCLRSFGEILGDYPDFPEGRRKWFDRVYYDHGDGLQKLSRHWVRGGPHWLRWAISVLSVLGDEKLQPAFRLMTKKADKVGTSPIEVPLVREALNSNRMRVVSLDRGGNDDSITPTLYPSYD